MKRLLEHPKRNQAGMTLVEYVLAAAILSVVVATLLSSSRNMVTVRSTEDTRFRLQEMSEGALQSILDDLRISGFDQDTATGKLYPEIFFDGNATGAFAVHAHDPVPEGVVDGVPGFGNNLEIVFLLPADDDRNGIPDLSASGDLLWSAADFSYVMVAGQDGVPQLERRVNGALDRVVATHVERLTFERQVEDPTVPFGAIRVRIWFRMPNATGLVHPHFVESTVRLRNTNREFLAAQGGI